jgi:hypothetical protein
LLGLCAREGGDALFGFGEMGSDEFMIPDEKPDEDEGEDDIDLRT